MIAYKKMQQAYGLWIYTCQIWHNIDCGNILYEKFDKQFKVGTVNDRVEFTIDYPNEKLVDIANNNVMATIGVCFSVFDEAMNEVFKENINEYIDDPSDIDVTRIIVRQIRNAYTHNPIEPKWEVNNQNHQRQFKVGDLDMSVNLKKLNGKLFKVEDINGYQGLIALLKYSMKAVETLKEST